MKLGLILKITNGGESESFSINKSEEWSRQAADSRSIIKELSDFDGTEKSAILVKFLGPTGYLVCLIKARPEGSGRPNDNTSVWIYVPAKMSISGTELSLVISTVEKVISDRKGINQPKLEELFGKEYEEKDVLFSAVESIKSNADAALAWRLYGKGTDYQLHELLGDSIAQSIYNNCKGICLIDKESDITITSSKPIKDAIKLIVITCPPKDEFGYSPYIDTNELKDFSKAIETPIDTPIRVIWKKQGRLDIKKEYVASMKNDKKVPSELYIQDFERKKVIIRSWIRVYNTTGKTLSDSIITINGKTFQGDTMEIPESDSTIKLRVQHPEYEEFCETNYPISKDIIVKLKDKVCRKEYILPLDEGEGLNSDARVIIETKNRYHKMPLKGYSEREGLLKYSKNLKQKFIYFSLGVGSVFVVASIVFIFTAIDGFISNHNPPTTETKKTETNKNTTKENQSDATDFNSQEDIKIKSAINYLDTNSQWYKDSLDKYSATRKLFSYMEDFKLEKIIAFEKTPIFKSSRIQSLIQAAKTSLEQKTKPSIKKGDRNTSENSDNSIDVDEYIERITTEHSEPSKGASNLSKNEKKVDSKEDPKNQKDKKQVKSSSSKVPSQTNTSIKRDTI